MPELLSARRLSACGRLMSIVPLAALLQAPLVCILHVDRRLDTAAVARLVNVPPQHLRLARVAELVPEFGFSAGSVGPWALRRPHETRVLVDRELLELDVAGILVGAGALDAHISIPPHHLVGACRATVGDIHRSDE